MTTSSTSELIDLGLAKALTNPMRQRILQRLESDGEQTSATLARHLGVTTGATSYNLRVLAEHGLVEEVERPGSGRQRWWRRVRKDLRVPPRSGQGPVLRGKLDALIEQWLVEDVASFDRFVNQRANLGEWADALMFSRGTLLASTDQMMAFHEDYVALLLRHQQALAKDRRPDARPLHARLIVFPDVPDVPAVPEVN